MNASQYAGTVVVPTLARVVLCAAFFTAGWAKIFNNATYTPEEVATLQKLNVDVRQTVTTPVTGASLKPASLSFVIAAQDEPTTPPATPPDEPASSDQPPAPDEPASSADDDSKKLNDVLDESPVTPPATVPEVQPEVPPADTQSDATEVVAPAEALALYKVAITLDKAGWQYAYYLAWATALIELIGGALLLVGLFSRVWGLGLAITMALAFHIMSMDAFLEQPFEIARKLDAGAMYHQVYFQLGMFVLAFGIFITGPGPLSLDRAIFRRSAPDEIEIDVSERM